MQTRPNPQALLTQALNPNEKKAAADFAIVQLRQLVEVTHPSIAAMNALAICYLECPHLPKQEDKAVFLFKRAAGKEFSDDVAMTNLGKYYLEKNTALSIKKAAYWFYQAAKMNTPNENGTKSAVSQLKSLAMTNHPHVLRYLSKCHKHGWGTKLNRKLAREIEKEATAIMQNRLNVLHEFLLDNEIWNKDSERGHPQGFQAMKEIITRKCHLSVFQKWEVCRNQSMTRLDSIFYLFSRRKRHVDTGELYLSLKLDDFERLTQLIEKCNSTKEVNHGYENENC